MILKKLEKQVDGSLVTQWVLTEEQTTFLINYAVTELLKLGIIQVLTEEEDQQETFLEAVDPELLHKA